MSASKQLRDRLAEVPSFAWRIAAFAISAVIAGVAGFLYFSPSESGELVRQYGYYVIAATFVWFAFLLGRECSDVRLVWREMSRGEVMRITLLVGGLSVVAWSVFPLGYKILYDELVLQATSWNLHRLREVGTMVRGYDVEGVFLPLFVYLDKRPYFFAFLVSLVHDVTGFRESNVFLFNAILFPLILGLFYFMAKRVSNGRIAWVGLACFGASPLLAQNANGAGMDLLNLGMVLLTMLLGGRYLAQPNERRLSVLLLACVLLAQTRYESLIYVFTTALMVLEGWRRAGRIILPITAILTPLLLVPSGLHNSYLSGTPELWELKENMDSRFDLVHFRENLAHAVDYFFYFERGILSPWWLSICGFAAMGWLGYRTLRRNREWKQLDPMVASFGFFGLGIGANLLLLMAYYWGQLNDPIVSRLILPFSALLAFAVVMSLRSSDRLWPMASRWIGGGALLAYLGWGLPAAAHHREINQLETELAWEQRQVSRMDPISRLILTDKTTLGWLMKGQPALSLNDAGVRAEGIQFHLDHGTFKEVLVTQRYRPIDGAGEIFQVDPRDEIPEYFELEPVIERMIGARLVRISRVVEINLPEHDDILENAELSESELELESKS